jgi:hypothetical protein
MGLFTIRGPGPPALRLSLFFPLFFLFLSEELAAAIGKYKKKKKSLSMYKNRK